MLARGTLSSLCLKKVNALTFKLKTHLGKVGGQTRVVGREEKEQVEEEEEKKAEDEEGSSVEKASNPC